MSLFCQLLQKAAVSADDRQDKFNLARATGDLEPTRSPKKGQTGICAPSNQPQPPPSSPAPRAPVGLLAGMWGPLCQKAQARQEAGRHRWLSEEIPQLQKAVPPQAQQSWGLLVKAPLLVWAAAQTVRRLGQAGGRRAGGRGGSGQPSWHQRPSSLGFSLCSARQPKGG